MRKNKTFRFTTGIAPEIEISLSGRNGSPLEMSLNDGHSSTTVNLDTESIVRLQAFLSDYLQEEDDKPKAPSYEPTGRALAVMNGDTFDFVRMFRMDNIKACEGLETNGYEELCNKVRGIADVELPKHLMFVFFDTFDGTISQGVILRILRACITYQVDFVRTGELSRSRPMILKDIESFTTIDTSEISRATRNVVIISPVGVFTLNSRDTTLDCPSLFDDRDEESRKAVLFALRNLIEKEDKTSPYTDDELVELLSAEGFSVARRTVSKYRGLLGIPKCHRRRTGRRMTDK